MLVYIRESDKEKIICNVDEKDVAEHLRVRFFNLVIGFVAILYPTKHADNSIPQSPLRLD